MTDDEKKLLIGDELTKSSTALVALCWPDNETAPRIVSDFLAHLLGRATALASSAVLGITRPHADRLDAIERRQDTNSNRISELHRRLNGRSDQIDRLLDRLIPGGEVDQLTQLLYRLSDDVEQLKARAAGDGSA